MAGESGERSTFGYEDTDHYVDAETRSPKTTIVDPPRTGSPIFRAKLVPDVSLKCVPGPSARTENSYGIPGQLGQQFTPNGRLVLAGTMPSTAHIGPPDVPPGGPLAPGLFLLCKA